jgi:hypothetical protein
MTPTGSDDHLLSHHDGGELHWIAEEVIDAEIFLASLINDEIRQDRGSGDVIVTVQNPLIILSGRVPDAATREAVLRRARGVPGVYDVCDRITVAAPRPAGTTPLRTETT